MLTAYLELLRALTPSVTYCRRLPVFSHDHSSASPSPLARILSRKTYAMINRPHMDVGSFILATVHAVMLCQERTGTQLILLIMVR